jgi:ribosomal protein S18 acetylase RimI-like enzyme
VAPREDAWLSRVLGIPAFAVAAGDEPPPPPSFAYAKVDVGDLPSVSALEESGFRVVDVNVTLSRTAGSVDVPRDFAVEPAAGAHHDTLVDVAGRCFRYSRFHLDPAIPDELADEVKREWIRSYVRGTRGVELLAALDDGGAVGFLAVLDDGSARIIDLVGVAPEAQGRGAGTALVAAFLERHGATHGEVRVGTQIANLPSLRLYEKLGFRAAGAAYVLHRHERR